MRKAGQPLQLLMVEPDKVTRLAIRLYLAGIKKVQVTEVTSIEEALHRLNEREFDCIVSDVRLPDGDAFDFLRSLYDANAQPPPMVVMTSVRNEELGLKLVSAGAQDYLLRTEVSSLRLIRAIRYAMERHIFQAERFHANAQLIAAVTEDPLTDFLNREGFHKVLADELQHAESSGVYPNILMVDLENLKAINESHGHDVGDQVLVKVSAALRRATKKAEYWAKIGGVFVTLLHDVTLHQAAGIGNLIEEMLSKMALYLESGTVTLQARVGVAPLPEEAHSVNDLIDAVARQPAELPPEQAVSDSGTALEVKLPPPAMSRNDRLREIIAHPEQLAVVRQTVSDLTNGKVVSYELMIRGPEGFDNPADLFDVDGDQDLLREMDLRCLETCLDAGKHVPKRLRMHVNIFPSTLIQTPSEQLIEMFRKYGAIQRVFLDVNTQWIIGEPAQLTDPVNALRHAGIKIALDHVEVGRSFMQALLLLKPKVVKTDPDLVLDLSNDHTKRRNLQRLLSIAISIGSKLVAVGLESEADVIAVRDMGIRFGQGYHLGELAFVDEA